MLFFFSFRKNNHYSNEMLIWFLIFLALVFDPDRYCGLLFGIGAEINEAKRSYFGIWFLLFGISYACSYSKSF
jgi:hypothetical protein